MPDHVINALHECRHSFPLRLCHAPHQWSRPAYGQTIQFAKEDDTTEVLTDTAAITHIQSIVGMFLYYARGIESPALPALNEIGTQQSNPTNYNDISLNLSYTLTALNKMLFVTTYE